MNETNLNIVRELVLNLSDEKVHKKIIKTINELRDDGFEKIRIKIETTPDTLLKKSGIDIKLFKRIKDKQNLPDWVVYDLIISSGKLSGTGFRERISDAGS